MFNSEEFGAYSFQDFLAEQPPIKKFKQDIVNVRVYCGGENSYQLKPFENALRRLSSDYGRTNDVAPGIKAYTISNRTVHVDILMSSTMREAKFSPTEMVTWLLDSDIHFVINHVHQSNDDWPIDDILDKLGRLKNHLGFPSGIFLECPAFTQDKYKYLEAMWSPGTDTLDDIHRRWLMRNELFSRALTRDSTIELNDQTIEEGCTDTVQPGSSSADESTAINYGSTISYNSQKKGSLNNNFYTRKSTQPHLYYLDDTQDDTSLPIKLEASTGCLNLISNN